MSESIEVIKRTMNRKGPNCDDFKDGLIRDLKAHVNSLLQKISHFESEVKSYQNVEDKLMAEKVAFQAKLTQKDAQIAGLVSLIPEATYWDCPACGFRHHQTLGARCIQCGKHTWPLPYKELAVADLLPSSLLETYRLEREVIEAADAWERMPNMGNEKRLVGKVKALQAHKEKNDA